MTNRRKICIVTGSRAEYGLLRPLMQEIANDPMLELQIAVTGMHLSNEFGLTYKIIEEDGFTITAKVENLLAGDCAVSIAKSIGLGVIGFADVLARLQPDAVVILGDRFEILAAAQAAMVHRIPIAHIHGGETTEGAIDESIRHSLTKMAHLHFVAAEEYRKRVIQLGEHPDRVFNFGAIGLDNIHQDKLLSKEDFQKAIGFRLAKENFLVTYHPVTLDMRGPHAPMEELLQALDEYPETKVIFTKSNADTGGKVINNLIDEYVNKNPQRCVAFASLGQLRYLSAIRYVDVVIGNSSSGLIEVPAFKKPTVNIGDRQKGRIRAVSVIDCPEVKGDIVKAIQKALSTEFIQQIAAVRSPYGCGDTAVRIKKVLKEIKLDGIIRKQFYDI
ncbi:UDP-N-acetylglucosamine 2-epimerase [Methylomusa anaerophila]|nr:UDP-N-acetylglucosamine 2-epimerase [Methylomusa anaerophila]